MGTTQPPIKYIPAPLYLGVKRPERELTIHLHLVLKLGIVELYLHYPIYLQDVVLNYKIKYRDNSTFTYP
jgi:hypothetical protein